MNVVAGVVLGFILGRSSVEFPPPRMTVVQMNALDVQRGTDAVDTPTWSAVMNNDGSCVWMDAKAQYPGPVSFRAHQPVCQMMRWAMSRVP